VKSAGIAASVLGGSVRKLAMMFLFASIPVIAGDAAGTDKVNQGGPSIEKRNFTEAEIQSTLKALGVTPGSTSNAIGCFVEDSQGNLTNTVAEANFGLVNSVYWLLYEPGTTLTKQVRFVVTPLFTGSPLAAQSQTYNPNSRGEVTAPLAIPSWRNGLTLGPWMFVVTNDSGQSASCPFTVQAQ
jgi:hypothetical protein